MKNPDIGDIVTNEYGVTGRVFEITTYPTTMNYKLPPYTLNQLGHIDIRIIRNGESIGKPITRLIPSLTKLHGIRLKKKNGRHKNSCQV